MRRRRAKLRRFLPQYRRQLRLCQLRRPTPVSTPSLDPMQEKLQLAPEIDGLTKTIEEKDGIQKVVYRYIADNPYGGAEGEYAGEFKKEVTEQYPDTGEVKEVGGVVLELPIIRLLLERDYVVSNLRPCAIPLDVSSYDGEVSICVSGEGLEGLSVDNFSVDSFDGDVPLHNPEIKTSVFVTSVDVEFEGALPLICMGFGKEEIETNYEFDPEKVKILYDRFSVGHEYIDDFLQKDGVNIYGPPQPEVVSRGFAYKGGLLIDTSSLPVDPTCGDLVIGHFNFGEKICDVDGI